MKKKFHRYVVNHLYDKTFMIISKNGNESVSFPFSDLNYHKDSVLLIKTLTHSVMYHKEHYVYRSFFYYVTTNYGCTTSDSEIIFKQYIDKVKGY